MLKRNHEKKGLSQRVLTGKAKMRRRVDMSLKLSEVLREHLTGLEVEADPKANQGRKRSFPLRREAFLTPTI